MSAPPAPQPGWAMFLDVDGTLLEIVDDPAAVRVPPKLIATLERLQERLGGAVALVSGRPIALLDRLFAPLKLPAAGIHGLERRAASGELHLAAGDPEALAAARAAAVAFTRSAPDVLLEDKGLSLAIHYRQAPGRAAAVKTLAADLAARFAGRLCVQEGKMVAELRPRGADKGDVVGAFMAEPPFAGRTPVFVGDDLTDELGFAAVNDAGGVSVRVGAAAHTRARYAIASVSELHRWLDTASDM